MRLIDADTLLKDFEDIYKHNESPFDTEPSRVRNKINKQPTVDAIEVVRCKDCKWFSTLKTKDCDIKYCGKHILDSYCFNNENWFCADGERKTE